MHATNMMKKGFVLIGIALGIVGRVSAQQDSLTVEQAVAYSLRNNYAIMLAKQDSAVAAINYEYRNAAFLPRLNATGTALFSNNNQKQTLADGSEKNRTGIRSTNLSSALNLSWTVFDGFRMFLLRDQIGIAVNQGNLLIKSTVINTVAPAATEMFGVVSAKPESV